MMIRQTEYASTTSTLVNCSNTYMYVQYHSLVLSENMCCSLHLTRSSLPTSSFILCSRLTIWWSRTPPCYYVQDVLLSILKCYRTTVTLSHRCRPTLWCGVGDNSTQWRDDVLNEWILYIHVSVWNSVTSVEVVLEVDCLSNHSLSPW